MYTPVSDNMADSLVYIAIDFGTAYSGYSIHSNDSEYTCHTWGVEYGIKSCKTPTCILFDEGKNFKCFGYAAMKEYSTHVSSKNTYFFKNFKMSLYKNNVSKIIVVIVMSYYSVKKELCNPSILMNFAVPPYSITCTHILLLLRFRIYSFSHKDHNSLTPSGTEYDTLV